MREEVERYLTLIASTMLGFACGLLLLSCATYVLDSIEALK